MPAEPVEISLEPKTPDLAQPTRRYEKAAYVFMALLIVYSVVRGIFGAASKPFWIDEFCTLAVADRGVGEIWNALRRGIDSAPPLFYLIEASSLRLIRNKEIALRLPAILAFPCTLLCVFAYVNRRAGQSIACLCSFLLLSTILFEIYLSEARAYSMVIACITFAMVCYQRLPSARWTALLALSLAVVESLHYFAIFAMVPFWLAEGVATVRTRRIRWAVWLALACGIVPLAAFWPLLSGYRAYYGNHMVFAHPLLRSIPEFYGSFFFVDMPIGAAIALASLGAIVARFSLVTEDVQFSDPGESRFSEGTLLLGMTSLPLIAFVLVRLSHAILTSRYMLAAIIGISLALGCALSLMRPRIIALAALFLIANVGLREYSFWRNGHHPIAGDLTNLTVEEFPRTEEFIQAGLQRDLPVVYSPALEYTRYAYYAPAIPNTRLVFLDDKEKETNNVGSDTLTRVIEALRDSLPLHVEDYSQFIAAHKEFLLYSDGSETDWVPTYLGATASMQILEQRGKRLLYLVRMKPTGEGMHGP